MSEAGIQSRPTSQLAVRTTTLHLPTRSQVHGPPRGNACLVCTLGGHPSSRYSRNPVQPATLLLPAWLARLHYVLADITLATHLPWLEPVVFGSERCHRAAAWVVLVVCLLQPIVGQYHQ